MTNKRILSLVLALLMVLAILPTAIAETTPQTDPNVVYGYSIGGEVFYSCDENGTYDPQSSIDPNTITHLFLQSKEGWGFMPLRIADRTNLRWVKAIDSSGYNSYFNRDIFSGYVNLEEIIFPENVGGSDLELFKNTSLRSFTLPKFGELDDSAFQGCTTIEEIINPSEQDVTLRVHFEDITIPAGATWHAEFGVEPIYYYSTPGAPLSIQLNSYGADDANPVVWSFDENYSLPDGFTLTENGMLTGSYPATHDEFAYIYVTATNGDKSAGSYVFLESYNGVTVTAELSDWITLQDGPEGEKALDTHAPAIFSFALTDAVPEGYSLFDVKLTEVNEDGEAYDLVSSCYSLRDNVLYLDAEAIRSNATRLIVTPLIGRDFADAVKTAPAITFPYQETLDEDVYPLTNFPYYDAYEYKAYKAVLSKGDKVNVSLLNQEDENQDTRIFVYYEDDYGNLECLTSIDKDTVGFGEQSAFYVMRDDTYYIFAACFKDSALTGCTFTADVEKEALPVPENFKYTDTFWFNDEPPLISHPDDLWAWDNDTKTLTLKDGFSLKAESGNGIVLPEQSTLIVEGKATIMAGDDAIKGLGDLTIELKDKADFTLLSINDCAINLNEGLLKVTGNKKTAKLSAYAPGYFGMRVGEYDDIYDEATDSFIPTVQNGHIEMSNLTLYVLTEENALQTIEGNITLTDCDVTIESNSDGFLIDYYLDEPAKTTITLTGCKLNLVCTNQPIKNYCGGLVMTDCDAVLEGEAPIYATGDITVNGGRLIANAMHYSPVVYVEGNGETGHNVTFSNVAMQLQTNGYDWLFDGAIDHVIIESPYDLCYANDADGILHIGQWDEEMYFDMIDSDHAPTLLQSAVYGDVDGELTVTAADALMVLKSVVGKVELGDYETLMGDVDGDKTITATDALLILQKIVGKIQEFPVQEM